MQVRHESKPTASVSKNLVSLSWRFENAADVGNEIRAGTEFGQRSIGVLLKCVERLAACCHVACNFFCFDARCGVQNESGLRKVSYELISSLSKRFGDSVS